MRTNSILAFLLALALTVSLAACGTVPEPDDRLSGEETSGIEQSDSTYVFINTLEEPVIDRRFPRLVQEVKDAFELNDDSVGWLQIPGTAVSEAVLWYPGDQNDYYYRRNFEKRTDQKSSFNGVLYADFRCAFGSGKRDELSNNTVIYGHNLGSNLDPGMVIKFGALPHYAKEDFAKANPYVYFSTKSEDLVWEVFSVMYATVNLAYNVPNLQGAEFQKIIDECRARSLYNYDTEVTSSDKILTLSTCTYATPATGKLSYPNDYRFVVMAKLVEKNKATKTEASLKVNPSPKAP